MEEKFKVLISVNPINIERALCLLKNKSKDEILFNTTSVTTDNIILVKNYKHSLTLGNFTCDAFITDDCEHEYLEKLRERKCKIRILK